MNIGTRVVNMGVATAVAAALFGGMALSTDASAAAMMQVQNNVPLVMGKAVFSGHHNPKAVLDVTVALSLQNTAKLDAYMQSVHDRSSPNFHKYLTPAQFAARYCPSAAQVKAVEQFLTQNGLKVTSVSPNNMRIHATASTAMVESAFGVAVNDYRLNGATFYSASTDPSVPSTISGYVKAVMGLDNAVQYHSNVVAAPVQKAISGPLPPGFSPQQIATAYDWPKGTHNKAILTDTTLAQGMNIAIATAYTYRPADIQKFWSTYGLPSHTLTNVAIDGATNRLEVETTIDIERSSAMSPGSNIVVFESANPSNPAFDDMFQAIATDTTHHINVMSTSWGLAENESSPTSISAEHDSFVQLAAEGILLMAASGDNAANDTTSIPDMADFPTSDPLVLAAGGTHLVLNPDNTINSESVWFDPRTGGGAGGADSIYFAQPSYQGSAPNWQPNTSCSGDFTTTFTPVPPASTAPPVLALGSDGCASAGNSSRQTSDMSMVADTATAYAVYFDGRWSQFGGTSFVAPELAGFFAVLEKALGGPSDSTQFVVYCAAGGPNYATDFHDVQVGANTSDATLLLGTFNAANAPGWDHPTGWGTPDAANLITDINTNCQD